MLLKTNKMSVQIELELPFTVLIETQKECKKLQQYFIDKRKSEDISPDKFSNLVTIFRAHSCK